mgnify:CR=1 FL=1
MAEQPEEQQAYTTWVYKHYSQDVVQEACLRLQDDHGLMVPILLHAAWMAKHPSSRVAQEALALAEDQIKEFVMPLRELRQNLRQHDHDATKAMMRGRLKKTEIALEIDVMWALARATHEDDQDLDHGALVAHHLQKMGCPMAAAEEDLRLIGALF